MTRVCSIDVGKVNLGVYIEEFTEYETGKGLYLRRVDLTESKKERVSVVFLKRLFDYLDTLTIDCDYYVIEKQLRANPEAQFVDHALQSYFVLKGKNVVSFSSKNKTKLFDETKMTKYQRKKWSVIKAQQLLLSRGESELADYVKSLKKKDDVSDAICQLDAWKTIHFLKLKQTSPEKVDQLHLERSKIEIPGPKRGKKVTEAKTQVEEKVKKSRKPKTQASKVEPEENLEEKAKKGRKPKTKSSQAESEEKEVKKSRKPKTQASKVEPEENLEEKAKKGRKPKSQEFQAESEEKPKKGRKPKSQEFQAESEEDSKVEPEVKVKKSRKPKSHVSEEKVAEASQPVEKPKKGRKKAQKV